MFQTDHFVQSNYKIEQLVLDTYAAEQLSLTATDVSLTLVLKKWIAFKYRFELWPPDVSKSE